MNPPSYNKRMTLADLLTERIGDDGQDEAVRFFRVSQATVSRWMSGSVIPGHDRVSRLAEFLNLPESDVVQAIHASRTQRDRIDQLEARLDELEAQLVTMGQRLAEKLGDVG